MLSEMASTIMLKNGSHHSFCLYIDYSRHLMEVEAYYFCPFVTGLFHWALCLSKDLIGLFTQELETPNI